MQSEPYQTSRYIAWFAGDNRYAPVVPLVDLALGAELLTSRKLVFGTLVGDPWVDVARSENASCTGHGI